MKYDVIIIGAGIAGLTSALKLAKTGKKVAVFEKHHIPGGYATNFVRKGKDGNLYTFDAALHSLGGLKEGCTIYNMLSNLGLLDKIRVIRKESPTAIVDKNKTFFSVPSDVDDFESALCERHPSHAKNIKLLFDFMKDYYENMKSLSIDFDDAPQFLLDLESISLEDFVKRYVDDDKFLQDFGYVWGYNGLPPSKVNACYYMATISTYAIGGHSYIEGGGGHLTEVMKNCIEDNNGKVYLSSEITKINTKGDKVLSVVTKKGDTFEADEFIFAGDPNHIFRLIDNPIVNDYIKKMDSLEKSSSITELHVGINCSTKELGVEHSHIFFQQTNLEDAYKENKLGNPQNANSSITFYDQMDPNLNKHGATIHLTSIDYEENWPERGTEEYKQKKEKITKILLDRLLYIYPQIEKHIQLIDLATPRTMARYTNNSGGAIYGWAQNVNQGGLNRISFQTPFENAINASSWSFPGGGFEGALFSGLIGAKRLLTKDLTKNVVAPKELFEIRSFIESLIHSRFNPDKAAGFDIIYKFLIDDHAPLYVEVKNQTTRLLPESEIPSKVDTTIKTTHEVWHKVSFGEISGHDALMDGLIKCEGNLRNFAAILKIYDK